MVDLTKPLPHVVTGLIEKRREIAGQIEALQARMRQAVADLDHVEAAIRLFKPDSNGREPVWAIGAGVAISNHRPARVICSIGKSLASLGNNA